MHLQAHVRKYVITLVYMFICTFKCVRSMHLYILYFFILLDFLHYVLSEGRDLAILCLCVVKITYHFPMQDAGDLQNNLPERLHPAFCLCFLQEASCRIPFQQGLN